MINPSNSYPISSLRSAPTLSERVPGFEDRPPKSNEACPAIAEGDGGRLGLMGCFKMASK